jgi:hypothetical protein
MSESRIKLKKAKEAVVELVTGVPTIERIREANVDLEGRIPTEIVALMSAELLSRFGWIITSDDYRCMIATRIEEERELELRLDRVNRRAVMLVLTKRIVMEADEDHPQPLIVRARGEVRNSAILSMI